jgi:hypothetical protein
MPFERAYKELVLTKEELDRVDYMIK